MKVLNFLVPLGVLLAIAITLTVLYFSTIRLFELVQKIETDLKIIENQIINNYYRN